MLSRVVVFAAIVLALAVSAPVLAPGLLSAVLRAGTDATTASKAPAVQAARPAPSPPAASVSSDSFRRVALSADAQGHFVAEATIDGSRVAVMVDTGATTVALTDGTARRLGIYPARSDYSEHLSTANGVVMAARVNLREVRVGSVVLRDVTAVVVPGDALPVEIAGSQLVLSQ